ncbi:E3 ubiquitin-protein ligase TRIM21-like [Astyanax mexicanus]|uniref:E3 ubiquitin-protein ligase TRIM21-like n=1 Tax=Astyanax mexicanus TaxID=7994 RepID=UPI0020CAFA4C|nr:E3 ubiquitin-protein ligase TRIM21-like [Astyanax mexicanus]
MASSSSLLSEDEFQCSICLDVFTDPVSTPCGHNFCMVCLREFWNSSSHCQCPVCKEEFSRRPELRVNTFISGLTAQFKKSLQKNTEKEKADSVEVFRALVRCIERSQAELLEVMEEKQKAAERQAEELIKELEQEITELKRRDTELEQISHTEDHLHLLQVYPSLCRPPPTKTWTDVRINTHLRVETLRKALSQLQEALSEEMEKLSEIKLKRIQQYAVDVTLDPDTAQPYLILSDDGKQVKHGDIRQNVPDSPQRFDECPCVLGKEAFSSGRFYYEVQVRGKSKWDLGVIRESSNRKGELTASPEDGLWSVVLRNETEYTACDSPPVLLSLNQVLQKVGVFVDYEEGLVSFYDVETSSHIYSFTGQSFTEKIYPYFSPCNNDGGKNSAPLIITPVHHHK